MLSDVEKRARKNVEKEAIKLLSSLEMSEFFTPFEVSYFSEFFFYMWGNLESSSSYPSNVAEFAHRDIICVHK